MNSIRCHKQNDSPNRNGVWVPAVTVRIRRLQWKELPIIRFGTSSKPLNEGVPSVCVYVFGLNIEADKRQRERRWLGDTRSPDVDKFDAVDLGKWRRQN